MTEFKRFFQGFPGLMMIMLPFTNARRIDSFWESVIYATVFVVGLDRRYRWRLS